MSNFDNKKLDLLLSLRESIQSERNVTNNNLLKMDSFYMKGHDDESIDIYYRSREYMKARYERDKAEQEALLSSINEIIDRTCEHEFVDDEIEHVYSGALMKIRYCCICEKSV